MIEQTAIETSIERQKTVIIWTHTNKVMVPGVQVNLPKPLGVRFTRGNDGGAYVVRTDAKLGSIDPQIEVCRCLWYSFPHMIGTLKCMTLSASQSLLLAQRCGWLVQEIIAGATRRLGTKSWR